MSKIFINDKNRFFELEDKLHYIKNNGKGGVLSYSKDANKKKYGELTHKQLMDKSGYRKAKVAEVENSKVFTEKKLLALGYKEATEEQIEIYNKLVNNTPIKEQE